mmetsp:Transcript_31916/g.28273  ORF Transcript_31916/g.28273 Transcript_31916/m.28273 type:complete len:91 (+) Transcript_31916:966-1238(+)
MKDTSKNLEAEANKDFGIEDDNQFENNHFGMVAPDRISDIENSKAPELNEFEEEDYGLKDLEDHEDSFDHQDNLLNDRFDELQPSSLNYF